MRALGWRRAEAPAARCCPPAHQASAALILQRPGQGIGLERAFKKRKRRQIWQFRENTLDLPTLSSAVGLTRCRGVGVTWEAAWGEVTEPVTGMPAELLSDCSSHPPFGRHLQVCSVVEACSLVFQQSREEGKEEKTEDNLTTLFPGQKRRISHLVKQGNVSAAFRIWIL